MSSYDSEHWSNNPHSFDDGTRQLWPLRDAALANNDRIAFSVTLGPLTGMTGLYVVIDGTTVSYDSEGVRHVQTESNWVQWNNRIEAGEASGVESTVPLPDMYVNYDALARQSLSPEEGDQQTGGGSLLPEELCERAMRLACRINTLSDGYEPKPSVADAYAVLDCIYVVLADPSRRKVGARSLTQASRPLPYAGEACIWAQLPTAHTKCGCNRLGTSMSLRTMRITTTTRTTRVHTFHRGGSLSINAEGIQSLVVAVLADTLVNLKRATETVEAETADQGRPLSVGVQLDLDRSLSSFRHQVEVEVEPVNDA
jgi:hypothetical protein